MTVAQVIKRIAADPEDTLIRRWNWKSALFSSSIRALIFLFANWSAGWHAATGAMAAEFVYRAITAGFYGCITQELSSAEPAWAGALAAMFLLPFVSHSIELVVHVLRGTPKLLPSIISSICFTVISTSFNVYAMRRGALVVGEECQSVATDMRRMPALIVGFVVSGPRALWFVIQDTVGQPSVAE